LPGDVPAPPSLTSVGTLANLPPPPTDMAGPGDILNITIYEAGVALFSGGSAGAGGMDAKAAQILPVPVCRLRPCLRCALMMMATSRSLMRANSMFWGEL
jgi:hypothetical protein